MTGADPLRVLQHYWKYPSFRGAQGAVIAAVLEGRDTVAVLPTGAGKSICYQVPALVLEGMALVISPLIALMRDQVEGLRRRGIAAAALHSGLSPAQQEEVVQAAKSGRIKLLYVAPERLRSKRFREWIEHHPPALVAVDEAHCISEWGHDFRPAYRKVGELRSVAARVPWIAVTATATPKTLEDIVEKLGLQDPAVFRESPDRPNLVWVMRREEAKHRKLLEVVRKVDGAVIVYVRSRSLTERWADYLRRVGVSAHFYHAGLSAGERHRRYREWMAGKAKVMVATTAFGMGIDKADVRAVVHLQLPESLENYVQEAGRAGRDGKRSYAVTVYQEADVERLRRRVAQDPLAYEDLRLIYDRLMTYLGVPYHHMPDRPVPFDLQAFVRTLPRYSPRQLLDAFTFLENLELIAYQGNLAMPYRLRRRAEPRELYDYQLRHRRFDALLDFLLRQHPLTDKWQTIHVERIARVVRLRPTTVRFQLEQLREAGLIDFEATDHTDWIFFLQERLPPDDFPYRPEVESMLERRTQVKRRKAEQLIRFVESAECRTAQILRYFGESEVPAHCGHCDVCLRQPSEDSATKRILRVLHQGPRTFDELTAEVRMPDETCAEALRQLIDEGKVVESGGRFHYPPPR